MSKAILSVIVSLLLLGLGVYFLLIREKIDNINSNMKSKQEDINSINKKIDIINMKLNTIEKPIVLLNTYSNKFLDFIKKYEK